MGSRQNMSSAGAIVGMAAGIALAPLTGGMSTYLTYAALGGAVGA